MPSPRRSSSTSSSDEAAPAGGRGRCAPPVPRRKGRIFGGCATILLIGTSLAHGQTAPPADEGPVFGRAEERKWITFDNWAGELHLNAQYMRNKIESPGSSTEQSTNQLFREEFTLQTHAAIIHPNLVDLNLSGTFGLEQDSFSSTGAQSHSQTQDTTVTQYNLSATFFKKAMTSFTLYAHRFDTTVSRDFGPTLENVYSDYGGVVDLKLKSVPTRIEAYHSEQQLIDPSHIEGYTQNQDVILWHSEWAPSLQSRLVFDYTYNNVTEKADQGLPLSFELHQFNLSHTYTFGPEMRNSLVSMAEFMDQTGDFAQQRLRLDEVLTLQHSQVLKSFFRYNYTQEERDVFDQARHHGEAGFEHKLFQSLVTRGVVGFNLVDVKDAEAIQEYYGRLDLDYTKKVPLGVFGITLGGGYDQQHTDSQAAPVEILDEPHTFTDPVGFMIVRQGIDPRSLRITDTTGIRVFLPNVDYTIRQLPNRVEVQRVLGGAILPNQPVLVDYTLAPQPGSDIGTTTFNVGGKYQIKEGWFKGLMVYARYFYQDQSISQSQNTEFSGFTLLPENIQDFTFGGEYRIGGFTFTAEEQYHQSTLSPYNAFRVDANYVGAILPATSLTVDLSYNVFNYTDINEQMKFFNAMIALDYQPSRNLHVTLSATYRNQTDTLFGDTTGFEQQLTLQWRHRQTLIYGSIRNVSLDVSDQKTSYQFVEIGVRRNF